MDQFDRGRFHHDEGRSRVFNRTNAFLALAGAGLLTAAFVFSPFGGGNAGAPTEDEKPAAAAAGGNNKSVSSAPKPTSTPAATATPRGTDPREGAAQPAPEGLEVPYHEFSIGAPLRRWVGIGDRFGIDRGPLIHGGVDLEIAGTTDVLAACDGTVDAVGKVETHGMVVSISCDGEWRVINGHVDAPTVKVKQRVQTGQVVGSTSSFLHFEVRFRGAPVDPLRLADLEHPESFVPTATPRDPDPVEDGATTKPDASGTPTPTPKRTATPGPSGGGGGGDPDPQPEPDPGQDPEPEPTAPPTRPPATSTRTATPEPPTPTQEPTETPTPRPRRTG